MKKALFFILAIAILAAAGIVLKKRKDAVASASKPAPITYNVKTVMPQIRDIASSRPFLAKLEAEKSAKLASKLSGRIDRVLVNEGEYVKRGDLLVRIDAQELNANISALQTNLHALQSDTAYTRSRHERNLALYQAGGIAKEQLDASEVALISKQSAVDATRHKINALEIQRDYLDITAPFDGTVGSVMMDEGDLAAPGRVIITINALQQKLTFSYVPDSHPINNEQPLILEGKKIGEITTLYSDAKNGLLVAEASLYKPLPLPNDSYLNIKLLTSQRSGCSVPLNALLHQQDATRVMRYIQNGFLATDVTVIAQDDTYALIEPCPQVPVAVASEAKLSLLPSYANVTVITGHNNE